MQICLGRFIEHRYLAFIATTIWLSSAVASFRAVKWLMHISHEVHEEFQGLLSFGDAKRLVGYDAPKNLDSLDHTIAIPAIAGRVKASLAVTGGVHTALDVVKATMAGAHATQMVSALLKNGPRHLGVVRKDLEAWMGENEWSSLEEMRGNMGFSRIPDPAAYERANFRTALNG